MSSKRIPAMSPAKPPRVLTEEEARILDAMRMAQDPEGRRGSSEGAIVSEEYEEETPEDRKFKKLRDILSR